MWKLCIDICIKSFRAVISWFEDIFVKPFPEAVTAFLIIFGVFCVYRFIFYPLLGDDLRGDK